MDTEQSSPEPTPDTTETLDARLVRLVPEAKISDPRRNSLALAHVAGVSDKVFRELATALRLSRKDKIVLPRQHLENLSHGKGWCRHGRGDKAVWGERVDDGYEVGPGKWTVGGNDGFARKREDTWGVEHVTVGDETWTIAS